MTKIEPILRELPYPNAWEVSAPHGFKIVLMTYDSIPLSNILSNHIDLKIVPIVEE